MIDIMSENAEFLTEYAIKNGEKSYRGLQLFTWLQKGIESFDEMTNINSDFRKRLEEEAFITSCKIAKRQISTDGTRKYLFKLYDGEKIESVLMKYNHGNSLCVSTQAGCRMGCAFCASTHNGMRRNLTPSEMLWQIIMAERDSGERVSHVVLMGMGEPLDNYQCTIKFLKLLNHEKGKNISLRNVSLSTCGLVDKINVLANEQLGITLSVSLHAPNDGIRKRIMPIANKYSMEELLDACRNYTLKTKRRISFEYAMIDRFNDRGEHAEELAAKLKGMLCHVNLIPLNQIENNRYDSSKKYTIEAFKSILEKHKITTTVRRSMGGDISAACGQLRADENRKD